MVLGFLKSGFQSLNKALKKTRSSLTNRLHSLFGRPIDENMLEELEEIFFEADFGVSIVQEMMEKTKKFLYKNKDAQLEEVLHFLSTELEQSFSTHAPELSFSENKEEPSVFLIVGTNGNGKTTTLAKLAHRLKKEGKNPLLVAGDTFRAGAQEQLKVWADRLSLPLIPGSYKQDPASVVFDALEAAQKRGFDTVLIDTAGRLENKTPLMKELEKICRTIKKKVPSAPHETLLILDATIGQNSLQYAKTFQSFTPLSGLILTKVDGSARGGAAIAIQKELSLPIKFVGTGEQVEDMAPFDAKEFIKGLFFEA